MSSRRPKRWLLALLTLVLAAVGSALPATPAGAQSDDPPAVLGTLDYENEDEEEVPVEGVTIAATDAAGDEVASVESEADGTFVLELPEPGEYTISIDVDTIPEGISLRNEDRQSTTLTLSPGQERNVLFALVEGEGGGGREGPSR
ncbi:MAG: carboxypeptidase-like regulatory domain-containing protein, partial [Acidimicrobiia bacterium]